MKQNIPKTEKVRIEPGTYDLKSDTLLSELTWHLLVSLRLLYLYIVILLVNHKVHKFMFCMNRRQLKIPQVAHARLAQKVECQTRNLNSRFNPH